MIEDNVVIKLKTFLEKDGWTVDAYCLGTAKGNDIVANKDGRTLIIEAKGSKGNASHTTRDKFDSGQIKTHFGKAIVKILEGKNKKPEAEFGIAHPDDIYIKQIIGDLVPYLKQIGIKHYWVSEENVFIE